MAYRRAVYPSELSGNGTAGNLDLETCLRDSIFFLFSWHLGINRRDDANPYDLLYVVGAFDTICKTCQQQYCSAGVWTGQEFDKVSGDGWCGMDILVLSFGSGDVMHK